MRVHILVVDGMFDIGLSVVLDTLVMANELAAHEGAPPPFEISLVGPRRHVRTQRGFGVRAHRAGEVDRPDFVLVPALGEKTPDDLSSALARRDIGVARDHLVEWHEGGAHVAAACTGTYVLASTGLLDGLRATTTWWLGPDFRRRFPDVELDDTRMLVEQGALVTAGAALAHVDLALWMVRQVSPTLASITSRYLLFDDRPSQATYAMPDHFAHQDPIVERFEVYAREHLRDFDMARAAKSIGTTPGTLQRRVQRVLGRTPIHYVGDLRVAQAIHRIDTTDDSIDAIAEAVGYQDGATLRALLRKRTGVGLRARRARRSE
ncbi:MAG: helix-turn-helix domain-containing protein [Myxococcales bacterium]|nr:helix-turn-helix domain-containing protein [Myxococcales bacterium]